MATVAASLRRLAGLMLVLLLTLAPAVPARAALPQGNAVKDPAAILRNALPVQAAELQELQHRLEATSDDLRAKRWSALSSTVRRCQSQLTSQRAAMLDRYGDGDRAQVANLLDELGNQLQSLADTTETRDRDAFLASRRQALQTIGDAEALLVDTFPFVIPADFADLPRLLGRATVSIRTSKGELTAVVDGYNAPLTAGAFVDLVQRGFYDGLPFTRAEDFYVLQTGDPTGEALGFVDPKTGQERHVPLEIRISGDAEPVYNQTFEDLGRYKAEPVLPFATYGTLGWAHSDEQLDDGSSQFFFFLYEAELTPAGLNLVDGRNAAFGYVVEGMDVLHELGVDDRIVSARVIDGADNLKPHA
ncbi:MAG: peptidylprolyl isomerase [Cyanobacteriota bacterium]|nr:peptidylprolyl isomerase [Cyanobacteriota bacterium]